jgi:mono/diheme cytochrome c family protein
MTSDRPDAPSGLSPWKRRLRPHGWKRLSVYGVVGFVVLIQAVPYGRNHSNPPVEASPQWDTPRTEALFVRACGDCHSNLTKWPWYTNVAPSSWLVQLDVDGGRGALNLSELGSTRVEVDEIAEAIRGGGMPPWQYTLIHRRAGLSDQEKTDLIRGLTTSLARPPVPGP